MESTTQVHINPNKETDISSALDLLDFYRLDDPYESIKSGQHMARAWVKSTKADRQLVLARSFTYYVASSYWENLYGSGPFDIPGFFEGFIPEELEHSVAALANAIGQSCAKIDIADASGLIGKLYASLLPDALRSENGIFYTPLSLVRRLMALAGNAGTDWSKVRVIDPACGAGAFLVPICLKIIASQKDNDPALLLGHLSENLAGMDMDPFAGWLCQLLLESAMMDIILAADRKPKIMIRICDSLSVNPSKGKKAFDLVIANPPYGKIKLDPFLRERFKESLFGHANLYGVFTQVCFDLVKKGGLVALLTPTSFLSGEYFKKLRSFIRSKATPLEFDFVSFRKGVFEEVLQETMLSLYTKASWQGHKVSVNEITTVAEGALKVEALGDFSLSAELQQPWILPRMSGQSIAVGRMFAMKGRLSDWGYRVSTGQLVWNRHKDQMTHRQTAEARLIIWAESVTPDGKFIWKATKKNHAPAIKLKPSEKYLITSTSCVIFQRTTSKEQHKRLIAALIPQEFIDAKGGVVIENHLNLIVPLATGGLVEPAVVSAFLNSRAVNDAFRSISGSVAVSAYELESFPLPFPGDLITLSKAVSAGDTNLIEQICKNLYQ